MRATEESFVVVKLSESDEGYFTGGNAFLDSIARVSHEIGFPLTSKNSKCQDTSLTFQK